MAFNFVFDVLTFAWYRNIARMEYQWIKRENFELLHLKDVVKKAAQIF